MRVHRRRAIIAGLAASAVEMCYLCGLERRSPQGAEDCHAALRATRTDMGGKGDALHCRDSCRGAGSGAPAALPCVSGSRAPSPASTRPSPSGSGGGGEGERARVAPQRHKGFAGGWHCVGAKRPQHSPASAGNASQRPLLLAPLPAGAEAGVRASGRGLHHKGTKGSLVDGIAWARSARSTPPRQRETLLSARCCSPLSQRERRRG